MIYSIRGQKDASLYSASSSMNTGLDEVLDVEKFKPTSSTTNLARSLVKFDLTKFNFGNSTSGSRVFKLVLHATEPTNLNLEYDLEFNAVSQSWTMGTGKFFNEPITTDGVSWYYKTSYSSGDFWDSGSRDTYGGTWYSGSGQTTTQSFSYESSDVKVDVSSIVEQWIATTIPNQGFVVKFTDAEEADSTNYGYLKFFSTDTNTIYKPTLQLYWDDSVFDSGSISVTGSLTDDDIIVYTKKIKPKYNINSVEKVRVLGRNRFPSKSFVTTASQYLDYGYLPTSSYYAVKDMYSGEYVIPFDTSYTKMSCDTSGNYFNFNFSTLNPNRLYKFEYKVVRESNVEFYTNNAPFTIYGQRQ